MKIGTDAVLLGAWCSICNSPDSILDIGSGTGVISLMMAQRSDAMTIDAIEIDENAYEQTVDNFEQSNWRDKLFCYNTSFQDFIKEICEEEEKYDLIVSNPPFYSDKFETNYSARNKARFTSSLSFDDLVYGASRLLSNNGLLSIIIPYKEEQNFIDLALKNKLFLNRFCRVKGTPTSDIKRSLLEFSFYQTEVTKEVLTVEILRHKYTEKYIDLTKNFYLKM